MTEFRVVDIRTEEPWAEHTIVARTPYEAAQLTLGLDLVKAGLPPNLVCKVYWSEQLIPTPNMVRLYSRVLREVGLEPMEARR